MIPAVTRRRRVRTLVAASLTSALAIVGCGVPIDSEPKAINRATSVPNDSAPTSTPVTSLSPDAQTVTAYFMNGNRVTAHDFPVAGQPTIREALQFTLNGPPESAAELTSAIPAGTRLISISVVNGEAFVDLSSEIGDISGEPQKQAFAQLVFTVLTGDVNSVLFSVEGEPVSAPTDNGNLEQVHAFDYLGPLNPR